MELVVPGVRLLRLVGAGFEELRLGILHMRYENPEFGFAHKGKAEAEALTDPGILRQPSFFPSSKKRKLPKEKTLCECRERNGFF